MMALENSHYPSCFSFGYWLQSMTLLEQPHLGLPSCGEEHEVLTKPVPEHNDLQSHTQLYTATIKVKTVPFLPCLLSPTVSALPLLTVTKPVLEHWRQSCQSSELFFKSPIFGAFFVPTASRSIEMGELSNVPLRLDRNQSDLEELYLSRADGLNYLRWLCRER